jgi:hypothetical protein
VAIARVVRITVPSGWTATHAEDKPLANWVHQRKLKKKLDCGEPSKGMTAARAARLTALGFVWDAPDVAWEAQFVKVTAYKAEHGHCGVSSAEDKPLANWVSEQRKLKKALDRGEPCGGMTAARAARLTALGFVWATTRPA